MNKKKRSGRLIACFLPYFKPYFGILALDLLCAAFTTVCELVFPLIVRFITNEGMNNPEGLLVGTVLKLGALYLILRIADTAANYYMASIGHVMGARIETDMRRDLFSHLQELSFSYYDNTKIGQIMSRITTDLNEITEFAHHFPEEMFIALIKIIVSFIIVAQMNPLLALIIFAVMPVMVFCSNIFSKRMRASFQAQRHQLVAGVDIGA